MEQEVYGKEVASILCQLTGWPEALDIRDDGVYVKDSYLSHDPSEQAFTWTPACEMDWAGAPDPLSAPALPIPFTSRNLAAFILDAAGHGLQGRFDRIENGPDEDEIESLGIRATKVRKVLREAYNLAQRAQCVVGVDNIEEQQRAADLLSAYSNARNEAMEREQVMERVIVGTRNDGAPEYGDFISRDEYLLRLARVNDAVAALKAEAKKATAESDTRHMEWRKAMVHQLLHPALAVVPSATPAFAADIVEPVMDGSATLPAVPNWKMLIQAEAAELFLRLLASGANPTPHSLVKPMAKWCRDNEIKTDGNINPSEGYIRTHVLGGFHWTPPTMNREQAKKHVAQVAQTKVAQVAQ